MEISIEVNNKFKKIAEDVAPILADITNNPFQLQMFNVPG